MPANKALITWVSLLLEKVISVPYFPAARKGHISLLAHREGNNHLIPGMNLLLERVIRTMISLLAHGEGNNHLIPGVSLDLRELELGVVGVHLSDLFLGGSPRTLMISTSWSTPLSPGKMGCPSSSSANTHPALQISRRRRGREKKERGGINFCQKDCFFCQWKKKVMLHYTTTLLI